MIESYITKLYFILLLKSLKVIRRSLQRQKSCAIEKYEDMVRNALIAYDAINATTATTITMEGNKQEILSQSLQTTYQSKLEVEKNQLRNLGVL